METTPQLDNDISLASPAPQGAKADTAVVLLNLGTPESPEADAVRSYLAEFLSDPEVIHLPHGWGWATPLLANLIAYFRARKSAAHYARIWTDRGSPLLAISLDQARALQSELGPSVWVEAAMRYGHPSLDSVFDRLNADGIRRILVLPMYPQFSRPTTGTALNRTYQLLAQRGLEYQTYVISSWHDYRPYWEAQAAHIQEFTEKQGLSPRDCVLLFSAHSLPVSYIAAGDPYQQEMTASIEGISALLSWPSERIFTAYQSRLGPVEWLGPSTLQVLRDLSSRGEKNVVVCPISFTADCIETLYEIGIEYRHLFEEELGGQLWLIPSLNTSPVFIQALKSLVAGTLGGLPSC